MCHESIIDERQRRICSVDGFGGHHGCWGCVNSDFAKEFASEARGQRRAEGDAATLGDVQLSAYFVAPPHLESSK